MDNVAIRSIGSHDKKEKLKNTLLLIGFSTVISFLILMICSRSSFLYPFNDWVDANCFFTMGKSVVKGKVMYRDIFEQKGPLLYFIHTIAYLISNKTFLGVFFIEVLAGAITLFYNLKTMMLYTQKWFAILFAPICSILIYTSGQFCQGDSAEELCLPIFAYCIYISSKAFKTNEYFSKKQLFVVGIVSGAVLWIKYTMVSFFIGWIIIPLIWLIVEKQWKKIIDTILFVVLGVVVISLPILTYFLINGAIGDLFEVYFYNNMFLYSSLTNSPINPNNETGIKGIITSVVNVVHLILFDHKATSCMVILGLVGFLFIKGVKQKFSNILIVLFMLFFIFGSGRYFVYYSIPITIFSIFGFIVIGVVIKNILNHLKLTEKLKDKKIIEYLSLGVPVLVAVCLSIIVPLKASNNVKFMELGQEDLPHYKFKEIICKEKNPTLLNYGFLDMGLYTVCDIVPTERFFCGFNIELDDIGKEQNSCLDEGRVMFVVSSNYEIENDNYEFVSEASYISEVQNRTFRLYKLKK